MIRRLLLPLQNSNNAPFRRHATLPLWAEASVWFVSHQDVLLLAAGGAAAGASVAATVCLRRVREQNKVAAAVQTKLYEDLDLAREDLGLARAKEDMAVANVNKLRISLTEAQVTTKELSKRKQELRLDKEKMLAELGELRDREKRLNASISHRGALGEQALQKLLDEARHLPTTDQIPYSE